MQTRGRANIPQVHRWHVDLYKRTDLFRLFSISCNKQASETEEVWTCFGHHSCNSCWGGFKWVHSGPPTLLQVLVQEAPRPWVLRCLGFHQSAFGLLQSRSSYHFLPLPGSSSALKCCPRCSFLLGPWLLSWAQVKLSSSQTGLSHP